MEPREPLARRPCSSRVWAAAALAAILTSSEVAGATEPAASAATAPVRRERHGLALSLGIGYTYAGPGLQARYDLPLRRRLIISPFLSAGIEFGTSAGTAGLAAAFGARHRLTTELAVGPLVDPIVFLHGTPITAKPFYGAIAGAGYEHMSDGRFLQRVVVELARISWGPDLPIADRYRVTIAFAFGWRIW